MVQLKDAMEITFGALVDFLLPVNDQVLFGNFTEVVDNHIVLACLRILSVWMTEGDAHMEGAITLLPLFLKVCKHRYHTSTFSYFRFLPFFLQPFSLFMFSFLSFLVRIPPTCLPSSLLCSSK